MERDLEKHLNDQPEPTIQRRKVVIVGTGQVGSDFAFALMISGLSNSIVLVDQNRDRAEGHAMDLNHGLSFVQPSRIQAGDYSDCKGADIVVITAGAAQRPGETRLDLIQKNTSLFKQMIPEITPYGPRILLIVSNPVDVLTYVTLKISGYPVNRVLGSGTVLDSARFRYVLGKHCEVDPRNVHAYIIGEHGDSEVPVWSHASIGGIPLRDYCPICRKACSPGEREETFNQVRNAAYEIIKKKGATSFAIGLALVRIVGSILRDEHSVHTVSTMMQGEYGIRDICLSVPAVLDRKGVSSILRIPLDDAETEKLKTSAKLLQNTIKELDLY